MLTERMFWRICKWNTLKACLDRSHLLERLAEMIHGHAPGSRFPVRDIASVGFRDSVSGHSFLGRFSEQGFGVGFRGRVSE